MSVAAEDDPYALPLPTPDSLVILPRWIRPGNPHPNSRYREPAWSLAPLIDNPGTSLHAIAWKHCPQVMREQVKLIAWTMINGQLRPTYLKTRAPRSRARGGATDMRDTCREWMRLARWLHPRGITDLAACTAHEWNAYVSERLTEGGSRSHAERVLGWLTDLWAFDRLSARPLGIAPPPWEAEGIDDFLPATASESRGENATEPLDPQVLGPLLVWAIRVVEDFADDILAAWQENRRLTALAATTPATPAGQAALEAYLLPLIHSGALLPAAEHRGVPTVARTFIAATTSASPSQVDQLTKRHRLTALAATRPGPCPLRMPVTGRIEGKSWRDHVDFNEAGALMRHLGTAAAVICLYLTGMRPQEVQALRSGCCPDPEPRRDGSPGRHLIRSRHYKNVTADDGHHVSAGEDRKVPWVAIAPVVNAIRVLERIVPDGELLFSSAHHDFINHRGHYGVLRGKNLKQRIEDFVTWANREALAQGLPDQVIPADPHGAIGLVRFRRTLAWHIARRPGGLIALAIQYGHMRTVLDARTSSGYGTRSRHGIHSVLDIETALAAADTAARLRERIASGEKISGPAARRALTAAAQTPCFEGRIVPKTFVKKATAFLARDGVVLYDNPDAFLICAFKNENALCEPDLGATAPRQYDCRPGCGTTVRTDAHARQLRQRADELDQLAAHAPDPIGKNLRTNADRLRTAADTHDTTAQPAEVLT